MIHRTLSSGNTGLVSADLVRADFIRRACLRYVQNRDVANDLTQDVLLKMALQRGGFGGRVQAGAWVYRVAANHCLDHLRRERRLRIRTEIYAAEWRLEGAGSVVPERVDRGLLNRLWTLSADTDREVIRLRFVLDLSQGEIAQTLGVSRPAVGQRLARIQARAVALLNAETRIERRGVIRGAEW